jgi:hypothetical protein
MTTMQTPTAAAIDPAIKENRVVAIADLVAHPQNYRQHPPEQIRALQLSLQRFGQGRSICIQDSPAHPVIVAGHGIVEAARALGWTALRADIFPADWSAAQIAGYLVADNELSKSAADDETQLAALLQAQLDAGYDLAALGSDEESLRQLLAGLAEPYFAPATAEEQGALDHKKTVTCPSCGAEFEPD